MELCNFEYVGIIQTSSKIIEIRGRNYTNFQEHILEHWITSCMCVAYKKNQISKFEITY